MIVPNAERAMVDIRKLRDYCLNPRVDYRARDGYTATDNMLSTLNKRGVQ